METRDISVGLQLDRWPVSQTNTSGTGNTVSVSVSIPLFIHHAYEGEAARAEADVGNAEEALRRVERRRRANWRRRACPLGRCLRHGALSPQTSSLRPPSGSRQSAELAYRRGAISLLEVLDARRSLRAARIERINAEADAAKAAAELDGARVHRSLIEARSCRPRSTVDPLSRPQRRCRGGHLHRNWRPDVAGSLLASGGGQAGGGARRPGRHSLVS